MEFKFWLLRNKKTEYFWVITHPICTKSGSLWFLSPSSATAHKCPKLSTIAPLGGVPVSTFHWNHKLLHGEHMLTSVIFRFGSGEMTVLPVKSTRFPERFPRNLPCFPFKRCTKPRSGLPDVCCSVRATGVSLLMYNDTWDWRRSQVSWKQWKATFRIVTNQLE